MKISKLSKILLIVTLSVVLIPTLVIAETEIRIIAPQKGFPIVIPVFCDLGDGAGSVSVVPDTIAKNLSLSGMFHVLDENSFSNIKKVCAASSAEGVENYQSLGAEGVIRGTAQRTGYDKQFLTIEIYLFDVLKKKPVIGRRYEIEPDKYLEVASKFSDEVISYFTGQKGIFSTKIAYVSQTGDSHELFSMDLNGQNIKQLTKDQSKASYPSWSPNGESLLYTSFKMGSPDLFSLVLKTRLSRQITGLPGEERGAKYSPDGQSIISTAVVSGKSSVVLFSPRGRLLKNLTPYTAFDISATWSPDGKQIAFCSDQGGKPQIYVMNADGGEARRVSYANRDFCISPAWSPKGDSIAFVCKDRSGSQIFTVGVDGKDVAQLTFQGNNEDPSWAPNGNMVVYASDFNKPDQPKQLAIFSLLAGRNQQITYGDNANWQPAWSPWLEN